MRILEPRNLSYLDVLAHQRDLVERVAAGDEPVLILVEHEAVVTVGRGARVEDVRARTTLPVHEVERGGGVTAHGPGQLVGYPIVPLPDHDLHAHLRRIERALVLALATFGIEAAGREVADATGVWTQTPAGARKLASIGIAARRWVSYHGFALNVSTDLAIFRGLDPCGFDAGVMTSIEALLGRPVSLDDAKRAVADEVLKVMSEK